MKHTIYLLFISHWLLTICQASEHTDEANYLKTSYLKNNHFIEQLPKHGSGSARKVSRHLASSFSSYADPVITGEVTIAELKGLFRLKVASTDNLLYQQKKVRVKLEGTVASGTVFIYSPVDLDFWQMAKLFIDHPDRDKPKNNPWQLKGYVVTTLEPGKPIKASAQLLPMADEYHLLLGTDQPAEGLKLTLSKN
jgi:hypothetical protein